MITAEQLGIPQVLFDACIDKVIKIKQVHKVTPLRVSETVTNKLPHPLYPGRFITKRQVVEKVSLRYYKKNELFGAGLLNFISYRTREGYLYSEDKSTKDMFVFTSSQGREFVVQLEAGKVLAYDAAGKETSETYSIKKTNAFTREVTYLTREVTVQEMAAELNISLELATEIVNAHQDSGAWVWEASTIATSNHLANAFSTLSLNEGVVSGNFYVNGKDFREFKPFGSVVFPFGKAGQDFCVDWVLYNEHVDPTPDWSSEGNFGEGARVRIAEKEDPKAFTVNVAETDGEPSYDAETHTFYYNPSKQSLLAIVPTLLPAQGKNDDYECLIDLKTGVVYYSRFEAMSNAE